MTKKQKETWIISLHEHFSQSKNNLGTSGPCTKYRYYTDSVWIKYRPSTD